MPYKKGEVPDRIKMLPKAAQDIWISAFNAAWDEYNGDEEKCNAVAWSAVEKAGYHKDKDGKWTKKEEITDQQLLTEARAKPHDINETVYTTMLLEEVDGGTFMRGPFMQAEIKNENERGYKHKTVQKIVDAINNGIYAGFNGHPSIFSEKSPADYSVKHTMAWIDEQGVAYNKFKILDTRTGQDLKIVAREGIPIGQSIRGYGTESWDEDHKMYFIDDDTYEFRGIDNVTDPSYKIAQAVMEQKQREKNIESKPIEIIKGVSMDEEIKKLMALIEGLTAKINVLETDKKDNEANKTIILELKKEKDEAVAAKMNMENTQTRVKEITEDANELKGIEDFKPLALKALSEYKSPEAVNIAWPVLKESYKALKGLRDTQPKAEVIKDRSEGHIFPRKFAGINEVRNFILKPFKDNESNDPFNNPKAVAAMILDNFIRAHLAGGDLRRMDDVKEVMVDSRRNPLKYFTETIGDNEMYTTDVTTSGAAVLPLLYITMQDVMNIVNEVVGVFPLARPTAIVPFCKQYYGDGAGTYTEVPANFSRTAGQTAEGTAGKNLKFKILTTAVSLETALKFYAEFTREVEQDLRAYYGIDIDGANVQLMRQEVMREVSHQILYALYAGTALANSDGLVQAAGSPLTFNVTAAEGYTQGEWEDRGLTKAVKQAGALINKVPWEVMPDCIVADSDLEYLFTAKNFVSSGVRPTNFGFNLVGTFQNQYKVFTTTHATYNNKILLTYRGVGIMEAAQLFCPYNLLYIDPLTVAASNVLQATRAVMSRFALPKIVGAKVAIIEVVG